MRIGRREFLFVSAFAGAGAALAKGWPSPAAASDRVRVGVIGVGGRGLRHVAGYNSVPGVEVVALCDVDARRLRAGRELAAGLGAVRPAGYADWRRMLERKDLDAVSIATGHPDHAEIALAACGAGKDLLLDEPRRSPAELARLRDAAREGGRLTGQVYNAQFAGTADAISQIASDTLDRLNVARARHEAQADGPRGVDGPGEHCCESLLLSSVEEFDYARGVLGVGPPRSVSCVAVRGAGRGEVVRAGLRYEFETAGGLKVIELEVVAAPEAGPAFAGSVPAGAPPGTARGFGIINFAGGGAVFAVRSNRGDEFRRDGMPSVWDNFVECVRSRRPDDLIAPLSEFTASLEMLQLAKLSIESGRVTVFPPEAEGARAASPATAAALRTTK